MTTDTHCEQTALAGRLVHFTLTHWHDPLDVCSNVVFNIPHDTVYTFDPFFL